MKALITGKRRINGERGLTLPELMVSMVLCSFVMLGGGELFRQLLTASAHNTDAMTAVIQVQTTAHWLGMDAIQSQLVERGANETGGFPLVLTWVDWGNNTYKTTYDYANMTNELDETVWEFTRTFSETGEANETLSIAQYLVPFDDGATPGGNVTDRVDDSGTRCYWDFPEVGDATLTLCVEAEIGFETQTRSYQFRPRPLN